MTTDTEYDTFESGIGISTLASQRGPVEELQESSPIAINGVALPESTVLQGGQGVRHFYPPEMARRAAGVLQDQLDDGDQTVHIVKNFHELEGRAPADDIIGEVTGVGYSQGVGVVFEGEITDETTAEKIQLGYLDISPTVARALGEEMDPQMEARPVSDVGGFRDIAVVGQGQPGADVEVGANPAIEALSRDALADMTAETYEVAEPDFSGYDTSEWDAPTLEETFDGDMDAARNSATWIENGGETFGDLSLFVLNGSAELNTDALDSAWRLASQTDGPSEDDVSRLRSMYEDMAEEANDAGAISDDEFDDVWQDRVAETDTNEADAPTDDSGGADPEPDTMSLDEATQTIAEEYDLEPEEVESRLTAEPPAADDPDGTDADGEESDDTPDGTVLLVEAGEDGDGGASESAT